MRIAHVTDFYLPRLGGIEMHVSDLASRQLALGHDVEVITGSPSGPSSDEFDPTTRSGVLVRRLTDGLRRPHALHPAATLAIPRFLRDGGYDVVHVHAGVGSPLAFLSARYASAIGLPTVFTLHSILSNVAPIFRTLDAVGRWSSAPIHWTAVSDAAAEPLRRLIGDRARVDVLPNAVDPHLWRVSPAPREPGHVLVVAVMRLSARKRPMPLLRLLRDAHAQLRDGRRMSVVIVGDGPLLPRMQRYVEHHDMGGWLSFAGRRTREQIHDLFARADLFVAPAILESFGIAALEARSAGLGILARADSGIRSFVEHGREGLLVHDDAQMARALARLVGDDARRARILAHNRSTETGHTWDAVLAQTHDAYIAAGAVAAGADSRSLLHLDRDVRSA